MWHGILFLSFGKLDFRRSFHATPQNASADGTAERGENKMDEKRTGIYKKYNVKRMDGGNEPGRKHEHCLYFVLDLDHDVHSTAAILAYANSCEEDFPLLAIDLRNIAKNPPTS